MIQNSIESVPEIHVNEDTDFRMTALLLELHETPAMDGSSACESENTGSQHHTGCCWSPSRDSPNKIPCSLDGNSVFPLSNCVPDYSCEKKQARRNEELHKKNSDLALARDSCIGRGTFAYIPGNGCYKKHKILVRRQLRKASSKGKFAQECDDEDCDPQTLAEFQIYLARLDPVAHLEAGDGYSRMLHVKENISRLDDDDEKGNIDLSVQKPLSADITVLRKVGMKKNSLPDVRAKSCSGQTLSSHDRCQQDKELDEHADDVGFSTTGAADLAWDTKVGRLAKGRRADDSAFGRESHGLMLHSEIMKSIKEIKKNITWSELSFDDAKKDASDVAPTTDTTSNKKIKGHGKRNDSNSAIPLARLPLKRNQCLHKPKVYHLSSLVTGPCLGPHQPTLPKDSLQAFDKPVSSINSVLRPSSQHLMPFGENMFPILEGRKIRTKRLNYRFL